MMYRVSAALLSLAVLLPLASDQTFGQSPPAQGGGSAATRPGLRPPVTRLPNHTIGRHRGALFPAAGGYFVDQFYAPPVAEIAQPLSGDINYNYTYRLDVPWDWAHRYPPSYYETPYQSPPPPVYTDPGCPAQIVTVPRADGSEQTISIVRC